MGNALWELYCMENQIHTDGQPLARDGDTLQAIGNQYDCANQQGQFSKSEKLETQNTGDGASGDPGQVPSKEVIKRPSLTEGSHSSTTCVYETLFNLSSLGKYIPRAILVDADPTTVEQVVIQAFGVNTTFRLRQSTRHPPTFRAKDVSRTASAGTLY
ncbi:unnamed protein product [Protopolystoma xenopodis]|uniref:Uncharacterized protein n=1 Tax=Protopolystoma xenopodis TaxID=117903 RepID=A0A3S5FC36_9PLAT|nr:unnamed protein product [Protopolystoma xenopodis]